MPRLTALAALAAVAVAQAPVQLKALPFKMSSVVLDPAGRFAQLRERNSDFLLNLNSTRLACLYTTAANLTGNVNRPTCNAYGHPQYMGHYLGHWLSATAMLVEATGDAAAKAKNAEVVSILAGAQAAWTAIGEAGFLFSNYMGSWNSLFGNPSRNCNPVCVPFYVYHKVLQGMMDSYTMAGNAQALQVALGMAGWAKQAVERVITNAGEAHWQQVLNTEWGGMNDALYNLYNITGDRQWLTTGYYFNHYSWTSPLAINVDDLTNNHANTHIPEVIGDARGYELTGNATQHAIANNFFNILTTTRDWATGGSNSGEMWGAPHRLGDGLNADTEESCTTYNILKVARHIYGWTADPAYFDFYERALFNGLIGNMNRLNPYTPGSHQVGFIYMLPLGGGGITKPWGNSVNGGFPCCWGTLSEVFAKLSDSIFFESADHSTLYVNLFTSAAVSWATQKVTVAQVSGFPNDPAATTRITVTPDAGASPTFTLAVRVPFWANRTNVVTLNGQPWTGSPIVAGSYLNIARTWAAGDVVNVLFTPYIRFEQLNDDRPQWAGVGAILYGTTLLAGVTSADGLPIDAANIEAAVKRTSDTNLTFSISDACAATVTLIPLSDIMNERYVVYWHTGAQNGAVVGYNATGQSVLPGSTQDFGVNGGAGIAANGRDENIRSGDPGQTTTAVWRLGIQDGSHRITGLSFSYQYVVGYGADGAPGGPVMSLVATKACGSGRTVLYTSPELTHYPFDGCEQCYSPAVQVNIPRGSINIDVTNVTSLELQFVNNRRNMQVLLPVPITVLWG